jgi:hypothetical protein
MTAPNLTNATWIKSSYSGGNGGSCVEVSLTARTVGIRDSKDRTAGHLAVPADAWLALTSAVSA